MYGNPEGSVVGRPSASIKKPGGTCCPFSRAMTIFSAAAPLRAMSRKTDFPFFSGAANEKGLLPMATSRLPGMAFYVLGLPEEEAKEFADAILDAKHSVTCCPVCQNFTAGGLCPICSIIYPLFPRCNAKC